MKIPRTGAVAAIVALITTSLAAVMATAAVAAPTMHGTFTTPTQQGAIAFTPLRAFHGGVEGRFTVAGRSYPGSEYGATGGGTGLVWYYGTSGLMAGNALVTAQPSGSYSGPLWFFNRAGTITDTGTVTVSFP